MERAIKLSGEHRRSIEEFRSRHKTGLLVLLFTDVVGSTAMKQELGDAAGANLLRKHNEVVRDLLEEIPEGEEISTAGDSFFLVFVRPSDAVRFSLLLHSRLRDLSETLSRSVSVRVGVHMGEVLIIGDAADADGRDVLGIQVDIASRVMSLGEGGQTLMSRSIFDNSRAVMRNEDLPGLRDLVWMNHGPYTLKGVEEPQEIAEVGEEGFSSPTAPPDSEG